MLKFKNIMIRVVSIGNIRADFKEFLSDPK